jgi:hypothetical protein
MTSYATNAATREVEARLRRNSAPSHLITRIVFRLENDGCNDMAEILARSEQEWRRLPDMGKESVAALMTALHPPDEEEKLYSGSVIEFTTEQLIDELQRRGYAVQLTKPLNGHAT